MIRTIDTYKRNALNKLINLMPLWQILYHICSNNKVKVIAWIHLLKVDNCINCKGRTFSFDFNIKHFPCWFSLDHFLYHCIAILGGSVRSFLMWWVIRRNKPHLIKPTCLLYFFRNNHMPDMWWIKCATENTYTTHVEHSSFRYKSSY